MNEQSETQSIVIELKRNNKGTGWIIIGNKFDCFIWNSDLLLQHLLTAMVGWADSGIGKSLEVVKDSSQKRGFVVKPILDKKGNAIQEHWRLTANGYSCEPMEDGADANPFI